MGKIGLYHTTTKDIVYAIFMGYIGSDNGFAPTRWQAIIWTNNGLFTDTYSAQRDNTW